MLDKKHPINQEVADFIIQLRAGIMGVRVGLVKERCTRLYPSHLKSWR